MSVVNENIEKIRKVFALLEKEFDIQIGGIMNGVDEYSVEFINQGKLHQIDVESKEINKKTLIYIKELFIKKIINERYIL